jgi:hypothetical protein
MAARGSTQPCGRRDVAPVVVAGSNGNAAVRYPRHDGAGTAGSDHRQLSCPAGPAGGTQPDQARPYGRAWSVSGILTLFQPQLKGGAR